MATDTTREHSNGVGPRPRERPVREPIIVRDTVGLNALARRYSAEHIPGHAPHETAASLLTRAGDRLEYRAAADYIASAGTAIRRIIGITSATTTSEGTGRSTLDQGSSWQRSSRSLHWSSAPCCDSGPYEPSSGARTFDVAHDCCIV